MSQDVRSVPRAPTVLLKPHLGTRKWPCALQIMSGLGSSPIAIRMLVVPISPFHSLSRHATKLVLGGIFVLTVLVSFHPVGAENSRPDKAPSQWQREDIAVFRSEFLALDRAFTPEARRQAEYRLAKLEQEAATPTAFAVELCRIAALADNGHTQCLSNGAGRDICRGVASLGFDRSPWCQSRKLDFEIPDFNGVPIAFSAFGQDFNVIGVQAEDASLLGARLIAVEDRPIESIRTILRTFAGGTPAHRDEKAAQVLSSPEQLHAVGLGQRANAIKYTFLDTSRDRISRVFSVRSASSGEAWHGLPRTGQAPWALLQPERPFRYRDAPEIDGVVIQLRKTFDDRSVKITDFLEEAEAKRRAWGRQHVVLDMRFNGGGNFLLVRDFMSQWPMRAPGRFFVLTSRQTFSAAIAAIAYLKQAGKSRVTIVGEPVGDRMMFFSDGLPIRLPRSGRYFLPAVVRMDYGGGCKAYHDCHAAIAQPSSPIAAGALPTLGAPDRLPVSVQTLEPDIPAPWTIDAWLSGKDPMMDAVVAAINEQGRRRKDRCL